VPFTVDRKLVIQVERRPEEKERGREEDRQNPSSGVEPQKENENGAGPIPWKRNAEKEDTSPSRGRTLAAERGHA
jgi:hypothetical protein